MGKFRSCSVSFKQGKKVFWEGELVSGAVILDVSEAVVVKGVRVYCHGEALTKWYQGSSLQLGNEIYMNLDTTVFGRKANEDGPNKTLEAKKHGFSFAFRLPASGIPSSVEGEYGAVRWFLKVEVDKPFPSINNEWFIPFTVLAPLNINDAVYQPEQSKAVEKTVSKALGLGNAGELKLSAKTDHFGYCPGESIGLKVEAKNDSTKDMGKISVNLVQRMIFRANNDVKSLLTDVASIETEQTLTKGTTMTMNDLLLKVPAIPPSTRKQTCHIMTCVYFVQVVVKVPWGLDLDVEIPVAIGTIPRGKKLPPARPPAEGQGAGAAPDPATVISSRICEQGIVLCTKSNGNFPNLDFTPCTAYVENFVQPPAGGQKVASAKTNTSCPSSAPAACPSSNASSQAPSASSGKAAEATAAAVVRPPCISTAPPDPLAYYTMVPTQPSVEYPAMPPSYDEVLRMDQGMVQEGVVSASGQSEGKACSLMMIRFSDCHLDAFRHSIRSEQNNLMDSQEAFLAALDPRPMSTENGEEWPGRKALAVLVFPDMATGHLWMREAERKGEVWYPECDAIMVPAKWNVPPDQKRLVLSISWHTMKESASNEKIKANAKNATTQLVTLREKHGGKRLAECKKEVEFLNGRWVTPEHTVVLIYWPKMSDYYGLKIDHLKDEYKTLVKQAREIFDFSGVVVASEDVTSLSNCPTLPADSDDFQADNDNDSELNNLEERAENLLPAQDQQKQSA